MHALLYLCIVDGHEARSSRYFRPQPPVDISMSVTQTMEKNFDTEDAEQTDEAYLAEV